MLREEYGMDARQIWRSLMMRLPEVPGSGKIKASIETIKHLYFLQQLHFNSTFDMSAG